MADFLAFFKAFFFDFFSLKPEKQVKDDVKFDSLVKEPTEFDCTITNAVVGWDKALFLSETLRLNAIRFMEDTPLVTIDGEINQEWAHTLALSFPTLSKEQVQEALQILKQEQDMFVELYLTGKDEELPEESLLDKTIATANPNVVLNTETDEFSIMIHNCWLLYVPGLTAWG